MGNNNTHLFIGMDVSEKNINIYALPDYKDVGVECQIKNGFEEINRFLDKMKNLKLKKLTVAMETGTHSPWMAELFESHGCKVLVGHARKLRMIWKDDNKCDERDAEMLARMAKFDPKLLHPVKHNRRHVRVDLAVVKSRDALVKISTLLINHVRGTLKSFGIKTPGVTSVNFTETILTFIPPELSDALNGVIIQLTNIKLQVKEYDKKLEKLCKKHTETEKLRQVKGVGPITALTFALVIDDPKRFLNSRRLGSYIGLTPRRDQSGNVDKQLGITKSGNGMLRRNLMQGANYILGPFGEQCDLRRYGERIAARGGSIARRKAKVAVARKLAILLRRLWVSDEAYDPNHKENKRKYKRANKAA